MADPMRALLRGVGLASLLLTTSCGGDDMTPVRSLRVERGDIVRHATAVGRIEPIHEVPVKSRSGGVITRLFVELGQRVKRGDPIAEVRPVLTEIDILAAERAIESAQKAETTAVEIADRKNLLGWMMATLQGSKSVERMRESAQDARVRAEEQLELMRQGQIQVEGKAIDFIVRAPAAGHVIDLRVRAGSPIVQSSSFGSGTVLVVLADMEKIVFRGTVDEIDVGRLQKGMLASIELGALPDVPLRGTVEEIGLRAQRANNAVTFPVRLAVPTPASITLRAGYSAVARIALASREGVLALPKRTIAFVDGKATVRVADPENPHGREVTVETGLSDGLRIEITGGLSEGDEVLERN